MFPSFLPLSANVSNIISEFPVPSKLFLYFSPLCGGVSAASSHCRNVAFLVFCWFVGVKCFFELVNMYINSCVIVDPALILYVGFENAACQFVGSQWKYFLVGKKGSSTKERIHDGRTCERKRSSLRHSGRRETRWGNEMEGSCRKLLTLKNYFVRSH